MVDENMRKKFKIKMIENNDTMENIAKQNNVSREYFSNVLHGRKENLRLELFIREYTRTEIR